MSANEVTELSPETLARLDNLRKAVDELYRCADEILSAEGIEAIDPAQVQRLNSLGVKLFGAHFDNGNTFPPVVDNESVNATEASVFTSALLEVVNMDLFELSLWRQWGSS